MDPVPCNLCSTSRLLVVFLSCWRTFDRYSIPIQRQTSSHYHSIHMRLVSRHGRIGKAFSEPMATTAVPLSCTFLIFFFFCVWKGDVVCQLGGVRKYPLLILVLVVSSTSMPPHKAPSVWGSPVRCVAEPLRRSHQEARTWNAKTISQSGGCQASRVCISSHTCFSKDRNMLIIFVVSWFM